jgi:hypothetical protein
MLLKLTFIIQLTTLAYHINGQDTCGASKYNELLKDSIYNEDKKGFYNGYAALYNKKDHEGENVSIRDVGSFAILNYDEGRLSLIYNKSNNWIFVEAKCG